MGFTPPPPPGWRLVYQNVTCYTCHVLTRPSAILLRLLLLLIRSYRLGVSDLPHHFAGRFNDRYFQDNKNFPTKQQNLIISSGFVTRSLQCTVIHLPARPASQTHKFLEIHKNNPPNASLRTYKHFSVHTEQNSPSVFSFIQKIKIFFFYPKDQNIFLYMAHPS